MQCVVLRRMVKDLDFGIEMRICPTVRAKDGLALSSRNVYLSAEERKVATVLFRALTAANDAYLKGERDSTKLRKLARDVLESEPMGTTEYVCPGGCRLGQGSQQWRDYETAQLDAHGGVSSGGRHALPCLQTRQAETD